MGYELHIYTNASRTQSALVLSGTKLNTTTQPPEATLGSKRVVDVYLWSAAGVYDTRSGDAGHTLRIGAGLLGGIPTGGTFPLGDGTDTAEDLAYNIAAADLETALNALNSGAGIYNDQVEVTAAGAGAYQVKFATEGAKSLMISSGVELEPDSAVYIDRTVTGDATTKEEQVIRLIQQPAIFMDGATIIANGWRGTLNANNPRVLALLNGAKSVKADFEVELQETGELPEVIARSEMTIFNELVNPAVFAAEDLPNALLTTDAFVVQCKPELTALTGGTANALDSVPTADKTTGFLYILPLINVDGVNVLGKGWLLTSGTEAENPGAGVVRPDDHAATTNEKVWVHVL